jgi:hypothetical protein
MVPSETAEPVSGVAIDSLAAGASDGVGEAVGEGRAERVTLGSSL